MKKKLQHGYLIIVAVVIIVTIAFFAATTAYMYLVGTGASSKFLSSERAYYLAQTGIERGVYSLFTENVNDKVSCSQINSSNANFTNVPFGSGHFSVVGSSSLAMTMLSSAISAADTTIPVVSTAGFSISGGLVLIDREAIQYTSLSGNSLVGVTRGGNGTSPSVHFSGAKVSQKICVLTSTGTVVDIGDYSNVTLQRNTSQIQEFWAVGNGGLILRGENASSLTVVPSGTTANLNDISIINYADGWVVGDAASGQSTILHWNGSGFTAVANPGTTNLRGISAVSELEAWTVGDNGLVMRWDGANWNIVTIPSGPATNFYSISIVDTNSDGIGDFGFAVGNAGRIIKYQNGTWSEDTIKSNDDLKRVITISTVDAFAAGATCAFFWRALPMETPQWHRHNTPSATMKGLTALDNNPNDTEAEFALAAGTNGTVLDWVPGTPAWNNSINSGADINQILAFSPTDIWAIGYANGVYKLMHWDGVNAWTDAGYSTNIQLNGLIAVGATVHSIGVWNRVYN